MPSWMAKSSTSRGNYGITVEEASTAAFSEPVSYDVWINVVGSDSHSSAASANATFVLTMQNLCYETVITCTGTEEIADYKYTIPVDQTTNAQETVTVTSTCTSDQDADNSGATTGYDNVCALTTSLEHYDTATKLWVDVDSTYITNTLPFLGSSDPSIRDLKV